MIANEAVTHTVSEEKSSHVHVKKRAAQLRITCRIEEFETLMRYAEPGADFWSGCVSSELVPQAIWALRFFPNGESEDGRGSLTIYLHLTGLPIDNGDRFEAAYHLYFINASDGTTDTVLRGTDNFVSAWGSYASHDRVREAMHTDGSLLVAADVWFPAFNDGGVEEICEECALPGDETRERSSVKSPSEPHSNHDPPEWTIEIEKRSINKVLNAGNVIAMAVHADSLDTRSAKLLKEACLELIAGDLPTLPWSFRFGGE